MQEPLPTCLLGAWVAHEPELLSFLHHRLASREDAEDLLQDVFVRLLKRGSSFCAIGNPRAWLFQVARNLLIDRSRGAAARRTFVDLPNDLAAPDGAETAPVEQLSQCLPRALAELSDEDRLAIRLCDIEGVSQQALAHHLGISLAGAKSRVQRARARLRSQLTRACQVRFDEAGGVCGFAPRPQCPGPELC